MFDFGQFFSRHKREILIGLGLGFLTYSSISSMEYSPCAVDDLRKKREELDIPDGEDVPAKEIIKTVWPYMLPSILYGGLGCAIIINAHKMSIDKEAATMAAYTLLSRSSKEYREKVKEIVGEKKEKEVNEEVAKSVLVKYPISNSEVIITGKGDTLCFEKISGRYFRSDIEKLRKIENELNRRMMDTTFISLNELYLHMGLSPVTLGDELGWDIGRGLIEMKFSAQLTDNGEPCLVIDFEVGPKNF